MHVMNFDENKDELTIIAYLACDDRAPGIVRRASVTEEMFRNGECREAFLKLLAETNTDEVVRITSVLDAIPDLAGKESDLVSLGATPQNLEIDVVRFVEAAIERERQDRVRELHTRAANAPFLQMYEEEKSITDDAMAKVRSLHENFPNIRMYDGDATSDAKCASKTSQDTYDNLLDAPGFLNAVTEYTMKCAPYPNRVLAFCGALALLAHLSGRKFATSHDIFPNIYIIALAPSGAGKDAPRKTNKNIVTLAKSDSSLVETIASGQALEDCLVNSPTLLYMPDEIDTMLRTISDEKGNKQTTEAFWAGLLRIFTSAASAITTRSKSGTPGTTVQNPSLTMFGAAVPQNFYAALNGRALIGGLLGRMLVFETDKIGKFNPDHGALKNHVPENLRMMLSRFSKCELPANVSVIDATYGFTVVEYADGAYERHTANTDMTQKLRAAADAADDPSASSVWARTGEIAAKLSLLYAISEHVAILDNNSPPVISTNAVDWAWQLVMLLQKRMIKMVQEHSGNSAFELRVQKALKFIKAKGKHGVSRSELGKHEKLSAKELNEIVATLDDRDEIVVKKLTRSANGKCAEAYIAKNLG